MTPLWMQEAIREFGRGAGIDNLALDANGVASLKFENGVRFRFEYAVDTLTLAFTVPTKGGVEAAKRVLFYAQSDFRRAWPLRVGMLENPQRAVFAVRVPESEVTLPVLNTVFNELWRDAEDFREGEQ